MVLDKYAMDIRETVWRRLFTKISLGDIIGLGKRDFECLWEIRREIGYPCESVLTQRDRERGRKQTTRPQNPGRS